MRAGYFLSKGPPLSINLSQKECPSRVELSGLASRGVPTATVYVYSLPIYNCIPIQFPNVQLYSCLVRQCVFARGSLLKEVALEGVVPPWKGSQVAPPSVNFPCNKLKIKSIDGAGELCNFKGSDISFSMEAKFSLWWWWGGWWYIYIIYIYQGLSGSAGVTDRDF